jgi:hypothetical protein
VVGTAAAWIRSEALFSREGARFRLDRSINGVIDRKKGGEEFEKRLTGLVVRIVGLHCSQLFQQSDFDYSLTVPGQIVNTNGQILSGNKVGWQFDQREAYPLGYVMECRSLLPDPDVQQSLLHSQPLTTRNKMLELVAIVDGHEPLRETLQECHKQRNMGAMYEYQQKTAPAKDETKIVTRLLKLLGLPPRPG